jgi:hypothetical protein
MALPALERPVGEDWALPCVMEGFVRQNELPSRVHIKDIEAGMGVGSLELGVPYSRSDRQLALRFMSTNAEQPHLQIPGMLSML